MMIREFHEDDVVALTELFHASVRDAGLRDYTEAQDRAWSPSPPNPSQFLARVSDGRTLLVALNEDEEPVAYGDLEADGHIDHLYCRPDHVGTGTASMLYDRLETLAKDRGQIALYVEASESARRLFERKGFAVEKRHDFEINGVQIHNYRMTKSI